MVFWAAEGFAVFVIADGERRVGGACGAGCRNCDERKFREIREKFREVDNDTATAADDDVISVQTISG